MFEVKLLKCKHPSLMTGWDVFELMNNATFVAGYLWLFEGDVDSLELSFIPEVIADGFTGGTGDMENSEIISHCEDIFDIDLSHEVRWYKIKKNV